MLTITTSTDPEAVAKSEMNDDCGGKMKIDDLIIIPNNINHAEEGGSALQVCYIMIIIINHRHHMCKYLIVLQK